MGIIAHFALTKYKQDDILKLTLGGYMKPIMKVVATPLSIGGYTALEGLVTMPNLTPMKLRKEDVSTRYNSL